jgi:hypothetical protein
VTDVVAMRWYRRTLGLGVIAWPAAVVAENVHQT